MDIGTTGRPQPRDKSLDAVKWLAIISMLIDHSRFIFPYWPGLTIIGRLAFPLFCLAMAANVLRVSGLRPPGSWQLNDNSMGYVSRLSGFALISEIPYRLLQPDAITLNIMPTLLLGLIICLCMHTPTKPHLLLMLGIIVSALLLDPYLMYGVLGVLLPATCYIALGKRGYFIILPMLLSLLCNINPEDLGWILLPQVSCMLVVAFLAPALGIFLLRQKFIVPVYPVGQWGYWFYPLHLLGIYWLNRLVF